MGLRKINCDDVEWIRLILLADTCEYANKRMGNTSVLIRN
jgi:hypothetical protein